MKNIFIYLGLLIAPNIMYGWYFYSPLQDHLLLPTFNPEQKNFFIIGGGSLHSAHAYNDRTHVNNPFALWSFSESSINMLNGLNGNTDTGQLAQTVNATDDGIRGHIQMNGDYKLTYGMLYGAHIPLNHGWSLLLFMPQYHATLKNIHIQDLTEKKTEQDYRVQELLTNPIRSVLEKYGSDLSIDNWSKTGIGDISFYIQWHQYFPQKKPLLNNVLLHLRSGIHVPTAQHISVDKLLNHSFGNEGAWALPFGGQLTLYLGEYLRAGLDVELTYILNQTVHRRVKTSTKQSELFLLYKTKTHVDFGMNQRFSLFAQATIEQYGLKTTVAYQYFKHGDDMISNCYPTVDNNIINSARSLYESTAHHVISNTEWNIAQAFNADWKIEPTVHFFAKIPFNGKNNLLNTLIGGCVSINF